MSVLDSNVNIVSLSYHNAYALFDRYVSQQVPVPLDTLCKVNIACSSNSNNVRVFAERLERDRIMDFIRGLLS